jgi:hypothetical protein
MEKKALTRTGRIRTRIAKPTRTHQRRTKFAGRLEVLENRHLLAAEPIINEFVALNVSTLPDEDGEFTDWIELRNRGDATANLSGYYLTDDAADLTKWQFPDATMLAPEDFLVVFASAKDRAVVGSELHTNFKLEQLGGDLALVAPGG